jgi:hypothetical protein
VNAWEWEAAGTTVSSCGLAGSEETARERAAACLLSGDADAATVWPVLIRAGGTALSGKIVPAGPASRGYRNGPVVTWKVA